MECKIYRAKLLNKDYYVEGFYFQMPEFNKCPIDDGNDLEPDMIHCLVYEEPGDWNMRGNPVCVPIDVDTLEEVRTIKIK